MKKVSVANPLSHYKWGGSCDGWNLVDGEDAVIKQEFMPPGTTEKLHFHTYAKQFFYILGGTADFEIDNELLKVKQNEGILITSGKKHKIMNNGNQGLEFLLFSYPSTQNDRTDCE